ncbi:hypothetical protein RFI_31561 [Reticulomyxa filosa]|uniref:Uncharacterized protein n=1 Tax=Reticulomyxa filosa TaxID=46433 RepID=X6LWV3_RETFI|nr:hypothetical protein RFI_31561 [Reticulomyxa filosa]|eukprot:ETO05836.1 hypothetical protein RFI_31561 [Reticulomyxa filosa]
MSFLRLVTRVVSTKATEEIRGNPEWRVFFQCKDTSELWKQLEKYEEKRSDLYVVLKDEKYGLKFRKKNQLELKTRSLVKENGTEYWFKTKYKNDSKSDHEPTSLKDAEKILVTNKNKTKTTMLKY